MPKYCNSSVEERCPIYVAQENGTERDKPLLITEGIIGPSQAVPILINFMIVMSDFVFTGDRFDIFKRKR